MIDFLDQVNNPHMKGTQVMMTTHCNHDVTEHEVMFVAFFAYDISLKPISNDIVGGMKIVFVVPLEPNFLFIYVNFLSSIPEPLDVVYGMIQQFLKINRLFQTIGMY